MKRLLLVFSVVVLVLFTACSAIHKDTEVEEEPDSFLGLWHGEMIEDETTPEEQFGEFRFYVMEQNDDVISGTFLLYDTCFQPESSQSSFKPLRCGFVADFSGTIEPVDENSGISIELEELIDDDKDINVRFTFVGLLEGDKITYGEWEYVYSYGDVYEEERSGTWTAERVD